MAKPNIQIEISPPKKEILKCIEQLELLSMSPQKRAKLLRKMGGEIMSMAKANIRTQHTIDGTPMTPRKRKHKRKRLLSALRKAMRVKRINGHSMSVQWQRGPCLIAGQQQYGHTQKHNAASSEAHRPPREKNDRPATRSVAKALIAAGYRKPVARKRGKGRMFKRASIKWVQSNMTVGQAGMLVHFLRGDPSRRPQRWSSTIPARPFLGVNPKQADKMLNDMAREAMRGLR